MNELTESDWLQNILTDAGWEQIAANRWRRPDDQEFSTQDAIRVLAGLPALECGTTWPLQPDQDSQSPPQETIATETQSKRGTPQNPDNYTDAERIRDQHWSRGF